MPIHHSFDALLPTLPPWRRRADENAGTCGDARTRWLSKAPVGAYQDSDKLRGPFTDTQVVGGDRYGYIRQWKIEDDTDTNRSNHARGELCLFYCRFRRWVVDCVRRMGKQGDRLGCGH